MEMEAMEGGGARSVAEYSCIVCSCSCLSCAGLCSTQDVEEILRCARLRTPPKFWGSELGKAREDVGGSIRGWRGRKKKCGGDHDMA